MKKYFLIKTVKLFIPLMVLILLFGSYHSIYATNFPQEDIHQNIQSYTEFNGIVIDSNTKDPLVFADINVNSTNIRTVTNKEGEFLLKVPNNLLDKMITVSYLGYKREKFRFKI